MPSMLSAIRMMWDATRIKDGILARGPGALSCSFHDLRNEEPLALANALHHPRQRQASQRSRARWRISERLVIQRRGLLIVAHDTGRRLLQQRCVNDFPHVLALLALRRGGAVSPGLLRHRGRIGSPQDRQRERPAWKPAPCRVSQ